MKKLPKCPKCKKREVSVNCKVTGELWFRVDVDGKASYKSVRRDAFTR